MSPSARTIEYVREQVANGRAVLYNYDNPTALLDQIFFDTIPNGLLRKHRQSILDHKPTECWFLITDEPPGEWTESLIGDYGILVVLVDDLEEAKRILHAN